MTLGPASAGAARRGPVPWGEASWTRPPAYQELIGDRLVVTAEEGSDLWRETSYGFVHDNGHGLLTGFPEQTAVEVSLRCDYDQQFDHAGVLVRADERTWTKATVEYVDGATCMAVVVTRGASDWSLLPVPDWSGREVTIRASRSGNALTIRARCDGPWWLVRVAPLDRSLDWSAGPLVNAPTRAGLVVTFTSFVVTDADERLHDE